MAKANIDYIPGYGTFGMAKDMLSPHYGAMGAQPQPQYPSRMYMAPYNDIMRRYYGQPTVGLQSDPQLDRLMRNMPISDFDYVPAQLGNSMVDDLYDALSEPLHNQRMNEYNNWVYDSEQPYGFDFGYAPDFTAQPNGQVVSDLGEVISAGPGKDAIDPNTNQWARGSDDSLGNALVPIARTAGSMALPMLFNMLLRGGK